MGHRAQRSAVLVGLACLSLIGASYGEESGDFQEDRWTREPLGAGDTPTAVAAYTGMSGAGSSQVFCPTFKRDFSDFESLLSIQNTGSSTANATVSFHGSQPTPVHSENITIPPSASKFLNSANLPQLGSGFTGSVVVTADQEIAATVTDSEGSTFASYGCFPSGEMTLHAPATFCGSFGFNTALAVQNTGSSAASVILSFSSGATHNFTVPSKVSKIVDQSTVPGIDCNNFFFQSVVVNGDQPLAVVANNLGDGGQSRGQYGAPAADGSTVVVPLAMKDYHGLATAFVVQNIGASSTTVKIEYAGHSASAENVPLGAGEVTISNSPLYLPTGYVGFVTVSDGQPLGSVGEIAGFGGTGDEIAYVSGAGTSNQSTTVYLPSVFKSAQPFAAAVALNGSVQVTNPSSTATTIAVTFYDANGGPHSPLSRSPDRVPSPNGTELPGGQSLLIDLSAIDDSELPVGHYSAVVESDIAEIAAATLITADVAEIFLDGFESGDTSTWSLTVP